MFEIGFEFRDCWRDLPRLNWFLLNLFHYIYICMSSFLVSLSFSLTLINYYVDEDGEYGTRAHTVATWRNWIGRYKSEKYGSVYFSRVCVCERVFLLVCIEEMAVNMLKDVSKRYSIHRWKSPKKHNIRERVVIFIYVKLNLRIFPLCLGKHQQQQNQ